MARGRIRGAGIRYRARLNDLGGSVRGALNGAVRRVRGWFGGLGQANGPSFARYRPEDGDSSGTNDATADDTRDQHSRVRVSDRAPRIATMYDIGDGNIGIEGL